MPNPNELARVEEEEDTGPEVGLPLALKGPQVFGSINIRVTLIPPENEPEQKLLALQREMDVNVLALLNSKMHRGTIELDITNAFGTQRTLRMSPAELVVFLQLAEKFVKELPR